MIVIDRKAIRMVELAWLVTFPAELGHERAAIIAREYLHSMVVAINDKQETSMMVERQASREGEQAISLALFLGADRELDANITIKSIVSHLSQNDKEMISNSNLQTQEMKMKLSHTRHTRHERPTKQRATNQQEPIDEGTKNSTSPSLIPPSSHTREPLLLDDDDSRLVACPSEREIDWD